MSYKEDLDDKLEEYRALLQEARIAGDQARVDEILTEISYLEDARHSMA